VIVNLLVRQKSGISRRLLERGFFIYTITPHSDPIDEDISQG
jgi:hypothetical protein